MQSQTADIRPSLFDRLRTRETQARNASQTYRDVMTPASPNPDTMLFWLGRTCSEARLEAGRKQVHIAASADVDQATINRFERAKAWPRSADTIVNAYADDLEIDPLELWEQALRDWRDHAAGRRVEPIDPGPIPDPVEEFTRIAERAAQRPAAQRQAPGSGRPGHRRQALAG